MGTDNIVGTPRAGAGGPFYRGELVRLVSSNTVGKAQADSLPHVLGFYGVVASGVVATGGYVNILSATSSGRVLLESGLTPSAGDTLYISATVAGRATNVAPAIAVSIGSIIDASAYALFGYVECVAGAGGSGSTGVQGVQGSQGAQGSQGPYGPVGNTGAVGPAGPQGTPGSAGAAGVQGSQGAQGFQGGGAQGGVGPQGPSGGAQGAQGGTGAQGPSGGAQGTQGPQGSQGAQGAQGFGAQGSQGPIGNTGATGGAGPQGSPGITGATGGTGAQGAPGTIGSQGSQGGFGGAQGTQGPQGSQGAQGSGSQGAAGAAGAAGATGPAGPQGTPGAAGAAGAQGAQGFQGGGAQGSQGGVGPQGPSGGAQGAQGGTGAQGPSGGAQGTQGPLGSQGNQGGSGAQGTQGPQGSIGATGATGGAGPQGSLGPTGSQGAQGNQGGGAQGSQGNTGAQGPSGGAQGTQGPQGAQGAQGNQGGGAQGATGATGATGGTGAQGAPGSIGFQGVPGTPGAQGATGTTGATGGTGPQGAPGTPGAAGAFGMQGAQGPQGSGAQGAQGFQGSTGGAQGAPGPVGPQGPSGGAQGVQGPQGLQGAQGAQGNQGGGFQGATGAIGATGAPGGTGPQGSPGGVGPQGSQGPQGSAAAVNFGGAPPVIASVSSAGVASTGSRSDHTHGFQWGAQYDATGKATGLVRLIVSGSQGTLQTYTVGVDQVAFGNGNNILAASSEFRRLTTGGGQGNTIYIGRNSSSITPSTARLSLVPDDNQRALLTIEGSPTAGTLGATPEIRMYNNAGANAVFGDIAFSDTTAGGAIPPSTLYFQVSDASGTLGGDILFYSPVAAVSSGRIVSIRKDGRFEFWNTNAAVSTAGTSALRSNGNKLQYSENGGAWTNLTGLAPSLTSTRVAFGSGTNTITESANLTFVVGTGVFSAPVVTATTRVVTPILTSAASLFISVQSGQTLNIDYNTASDGTGGSLGMQMSGTTGNVAVVHDLTVTTGTLTVPIAVITSSAAGSPGIALTLNQAADQAIVKSGGSFYLGTYDLNVLTFLINNIGVAQFDTSGNFVMGFANSSISMTAATSQGILKSGGTLFFGTSDANGIIIDTNGADIAAFDTSGNFLLTAAANQTITKTGGQLYIGTDDANAMFFKTNGVIRVEIDAAGNLTIPGNAEIDGIVQYGAGSLAANGAVATSLGSVGPTGSHTTVQEWLTVKGSGGATRYIPAF
jgi:hypothetical protein